MIVCDCLCVSVCECDSWVAHTLVAASTLAPCLMSSATTSTWPSFEARWRAFRPFWRGTEKRERAFKKHFLHFHLETSSIIRRFCPYNIQINGTALVFIVFIEAQGYQYLAFLLLSRTCMHFQKPFLNIVCNNK